MVETNWAGRGVTRTRGLPRELTSFALPLPMCKKLIRLGSDSSQICIQRSALLLA